MYTITLVYSCVRFTRSEVDPTVPPFWIDIGYLAEVSFAHPQAFWSVVCDKFRIFVSDRRPGAIEFPSVRATVCYHS